MPPVLDAVFAARGQVSSDFGPAVADLGLHADNGFVLVLGPGALFVFLLRMGIISMPALLASASVDLCGDVCPVMSASAAYRFGKYSILLGRPWPSSFPCFRVLKLAHAYKIKSDPLAATEPGSILIEHG